MMRNLSERRNPPQYPFEKEERTEVACLQARSKGGLKNIEK